MRIIDSHLHLQFDHVWPRRRELIAAAQENGVEKLICCGTNEQDWQLVAELAEEFPSVKPCFGVHPWWCDKTTDSWKEMLRAYLLRYSSAVGEIGLDRAARSDWQKQQQIFGEQLVLAAALRRPVIVHCVQAWERTMQMLQPALAMRLPVLFHGFGGSLETMHELAKRGAYFSFSSYVLEKGRERLREVLAAVPRNRLLIETDWPPASDSDHAGRRSADEPSGLPLVVCELAGVLGLDPEEFAELTYANAQLFFGPAFAL